MGDLLWNAKEVMFLDFYCFLAPICILLRKFWEKQPSVCKNKNLNNYKNREITHLAATRSTERLHRFSNCPSLLQSAGLNWWVKKWKKYGARELWRWGKTHVQNTAFNRAKKTSYIFSLNVLFSAFGLTICFTWKALHEVQQSLNLPNSPRGTSGTTSSQLAFLSNPPEALSSFCLPPQSSMLDLC